jgi:hypothetical protein
VSKSPSCDPGEWDQFGISLNYLVRLDRNLGVTVAISNSSGQGLTGKRRNPVLVWLVWPFITLGIYHLYWWYKINDEARRIDPSIDVNPLLSLLALFPGALIIGPPFVTVYRTGDRIRSMQRAAGRTPDVLPIIGLLLAFLFSLYALYYQISLNGIWSALGDPPENTSVAIQS